jgi:hypothetical protein
MDYDKHLQRFYQSLAPYSDLSGLGQQSVQATGLLGTRTAEGIADAYKWKADAQATSMNNMAQSLGMAAYGGAKIYKNLK